MRGKVFRDSHNISFRLSGMLACFSILLVSLASRAEQEDNWWKDHPAKKVASYNFSPAAPLEDRVSPPPEFVLDFTRRWDEKYTTEAAYYRAYAPTAGELEEVKSAIRKLPKEIKEKVSPYLLGIYFVENLLGSGFAEFVPDEGGDHYFMLFNPKVLKMGASEWITGKEKSCFIEEPGYELKIDIGEGLSGFYYIFNHEISHVYDYIAKVTPGENVPKSKKDMAKHLFIKGIWKEFAEPKRIYGFAGRDEITFYGTNDGPKIKISDAPGIYDGLRLYSPFLTLYGSLNWMEDFAEYSAAYMNSRIYNRPWRLTISKDGEVIYEMKDILERENIKERVEFVEKLLEHTGSQK